MSQPSLSKRRKLDRFAGRSLLILAAFPLVLVIVIIITLTVRSWPILKTNSLWGLLTGVDWHPQNGQFGFLPFIMGTVWVTVVAMILQERG